MHHANHAIITCNPFASATLKAAALMPSRSPPTTMTGCWLRQPLQQGQCQSRRRRQQALQAVAAQNAHRRRLRRRCRWLLHLAMGMRSTAAVTGRSNLLAMMMQPPPSAAMSPLQTPRTMR